MKDMQIAKLMKHRWEEEPISGIGRGYDGTFAIFFYGCTMRCVYCQNSKISHRRGVLCEPEKVNYTPEELSDVIIKALPDNVASISFITGALYVDQIVETIKLAKKKGLKLPVVYNSSGYETAAQIKKLDGLVDIYLPDFKYFDNELGKKYSSVPNYVDVTKECIAEMHRQVTKLNLGDESNEVGAEGKKVDAGIKKEVVGAKACRALCIVRHLVLPGNTENSKQVIKYLYDTYGDDIYLSIMSQYTPMPQNENIDKFPELLRKVTKREYEKVVDYAISLGVKNAFIQEGDVANESFIPEFR